MSQQFETAAARVENPVPGVPTKLLIGTPGPSSPTGAELWAG